MDAAILDLWPELEWIKNPDLRNATARTWEVAMERSPLTPDDLRTIPFTLLVKDLDVTFMEHKRAVVHIARRSAEAMEQFFGEKLPIDHDVVISGAILAD
ncbi:MAG: phosphohydrolase, partial [Gemmatimonadetes bacterium]|nr:phosphohydrolase [Gemmatimonadota bacterium]